MTTLDVPPAPAPDGLPPATRGDLGSVLRLVGAVSALAVLSVVVGFWKPLLVIVALFVMVMLHELGHFVMARRAGMKATEFFVGFGPRLWSIRRGETEYGVKALPLGGYVKIIGMTNLEKVPEEDEPRAYRQKPFWGRFGVAVAGSAVHMVLALLLLFALNTVVGNGLHARQVPIIRELRGIEGKPVPAIDAGLQVVDEIKAVDGTPLADFAGFRSYVGARPGQSIRVDYERGGRPATTTLTPVEVTTPAEGDEPAETRGYVGITARTVAPTVGPVQAVGRSVKDLGTLVTGTAAGLTTLLSFQGVQSYANQVQGKEVPKEEKGNRFLSPVGVYKIAGTAADEGIGPVISLLALINVFVGIFNMMPLLPFDGGHVSLAVYEAVRSRIKGRRHFADAAKLMPFAYLTVAALALIFVSSLYLDIAKPFDLSELR
ncbi:MAG: site-2 protease family protein [Acidimicrobiales bacterium]